jgi:predicted O-linked N-acetylglucosamine transferase (SPINDLY family)
VVPNAVPFTDQDAPNIVPPSRRPTFGSFNTHWKLNDDVFRLWARVLDRCPEAHLVIKSTGFKATALRDIYKEKAVRCGIDPDRLELRRPVSRQVHFDAFSDIDVMLDPFPFTGGVSIIEALWMGVPVVSRHGDFPSQRTGLRYLTEAGVPHWSVSSEEDYLDLAQSLMRDETFRRDFRRTSRELLLASSIFDGQSMAETLSKAFRGMWRAAFDRN